MAKMHFATLGYDSATLSGIAADAKTTKSTLSYYFSTKEKLFDEILRDAICNFSARLVQIACSRNSAGQKLTKMSRLYFQFLLDGGDLRTILEKESARLAKNPSFEYIAEAKADIDDSWRHVLVQAFEENSSLVRSSSLSTARKLFDTFDIASALEEVDCDHRTRKLFKDNLLEQIILSLSME
ncbi:MAG: TetR/AcrR family transcriptional regulator [Sphingobium sp.]